MNITDIFIRKPVLSLVVSLLITIAGVQALLTLNIRQYPRSENAAVTITTAYVGASAELVRGFITTPLERAIAAADGVQCTASDAEDGDVDAGTLLDAGESGKPPGGAEDGAGSGAMLFFHAPADFRSCR